MNNPNSHSPDSVASPRVFENKDDDYDYDYDLPSLPSIPRLSDTGRSFQEQLAAATRKNSGGRKKRRRKSRKKKRKSRRKTRKKRRRKSRKKRKTRRRKKGGVKTSAFKKTNATMKRSKTVSNLVGLAKKSKPHASRMTRQGFKPPRTASSLSKHVTFRPISPQSQPPLMRQPSQGSQAAQQPLAQQPLLQLMGDMSINPPSPTSSEEELSKFTEEENP